MAVGLTDLDTGGTELQILICSSWIDRVVKSVIVIKISGLILRCVVFNELDKLRIDRGGRWGSARDPCRSIYWWIIQGTKGLVTSSENGSESDKHQRTRNNSSRMSTARLLTVSQYALGRGVCRGCLPGGGLCQTPPGTRGRHPSIDRQTPMKK